jgi:GNAT superfamily N-acetyltransferase
MTTYIVREARHSDLPSLQEIERAAGAPFAELGMTAVAEDPPPSLEALGEYVTAGRCWVSAGPDGRPVAYLITDVVDGCAHVEQVSVHPVAQRRGLGAALIDRAATWAAEHGLPALTLTTYAEVPWNGPYYERLGFRYLTETEETSGLRAIRDAERAHALDLWPRACMRRDLTPFPARLRPARPDEAAALSELALRSKGHWGHSPEFLEACRAELTVSDQQVPQVTVAEVDGTLAGFYLLEIDQERGELDMLFVDPPWIGRAIGGLLLRRALDEAAERGARTVELDADPDAAAFYARYGAARIGDVASGSVSGRVLPRMRFTLPTGQEAATCVD